MEFGVKNTMISIDNQINELRYKMKRIQLEANSLQKRIDTKRKHKQLNEEEEYSLGRQISQLNAESKAIEGEIRKLENQKVRAEQFAGSSEDEIGLE